MINNNSSFFRTGLGQVERNMGDVYQRYTNLPAVFRVGTYLVAENAIESVGASLSVCIAQRLADHSAVKHCYSQLSQSIGKSIGCLATALAFRCLANHAFRFINAPNISTQEFAKRCAICVFATMAIFAIAKESAAFLSDAAIPLSVEGVVGIIGGFAAVYSMGSQEEMLPSDGEWYDSYFVKSLQAMIGCALQDLYIDNNSLVYIPASLTMATLSYNIVDIYRLFSAIKEQRALSGILPGNISHKIMREIRVPISSQQDLAEAVASGRGVRKRVVARMHQAVQYISNEENYDFRIIFKEVVKQVQRSEIFRKQVRDFVEPMLKELKVEDFGDLAVDFTEAALQSVLKGVLNYLQQCQNDPQIMEAEEQIYRLSAQLEQATEDEERAQILEEIATRKQDIRRSVENLTLALDQNLAVVQNLPVWLTSRLRTFMDQKIERRIEDMTRLINSHIDGIERKLSGIQLRHTHGKEAYKHILQAKILGSLPYIVYKLASSPRTGNAPLTEEEEKELYKRGVAEITHHYSKATNGWIGPIFPLFSQIFNAQMEHSTLDAS